MAHLWVKDADGWQAEKLGTAPFDLVRTPALPADNAQPGAACDKLAQLFCTGGGGSRVWALVVTLDAQVRVNGHAVVAGICVLSDRDEIRTAYGHQYFFSTESLAAVEAFPTPERPVFCGRCRQPIETGANAVRCPRCSTWYNQSVELPCWTYAEKCTFCGCSTDLDAGFFWTPEA